MIDEYLRGEKLYGNDFSVEQIQKWFQEETEGYADLGSKYHKAEQYGYHALNRINGFSKIRKKELGNILGLGSAWGFEFEPYSERISSITIIEPSENLVSEKIGNHKPVYVKPSVKGTISFEDNSFDTVTCFGTLHHIPNVSYVLSELLRVLKPGGYLLLREPINSMGDWRKERKNLTRNERGIPTHIFEEEFRKFNVKIVSKIFCFTGMAFLQKKFGSLFRNAVFTYDTYIHIDNWVSKVFSSNIRYHATRKIHKFQPQAVFYVVQKR